MLSKKAGRGETIAHRKTYLIPDSLPKNRFPYHQKLGNHQNHSLHQSNFEYRQRRLKIPQFDVWQCFFYLRHAFETLCIFSNNSQASQRFMQFKMDDFFSLVRIVVLVILNFIKEAAVYCAPISPLLFNLVQLQCTLA